MNVEETRREGLIGLSEVVWRLIQGCFTDFRFIDSVFVELRMLCLYFLKLVFDALRFHG